MVKAALLDLDGTLVEADMSVVIAEIAGKEDEVRQNNLNFHKGVTKGLTGLIASINLFKGITLDQIEEKLGKQDYLLSGAPELLKFLRDIGSRPRIRDGVIEGISEEDYPVLTLNFLRQRRSLRR